MRIPNGKVGGTAGSLLIIETAEKSLGGRKSMVGCWCPGHFHVYLLSNVLLISRLLCTPGICKLSTEITVLSGPFVIALRNSPRAWQSHFQCLHSNMSFLFLFFERQIQCIWLWPEFSGYVKSKDPVCVRQKANKPNFPLGNAIDMFAHRMLKSTPCSI